MSELRKIGSYRHDTNFFMGVIRNSHAVARADNPHADEDDKVFQENRAKYINQITATMNEGQAPCCAVCSTPMKAGYHIHHKDGDHRNNDLVNFELLDPFCHLCYHLGYIGSNELGTIIYEPNLSQATINQMQIITYAHQYIMKHTNKASQAYQLLKRQSGELHVVMEALEASKAVVLRNFQTNDPLHFANVFAHMSEDEYANRANGTFSGLRILFDPNKFEKEIKLFAENLFSMSNTSGQYFPTQWDNHAKQLKQN
ncbi:HNH endonuclease signature motif containing protein [Vibrio sp. Hal054]|uniref:HNH endonuclease signature motif containing protein n=1 Tax=Vibrio sp. Hal054 TaxID=3035158 RepID=UPI00301C740B